MDLRNLINWFNKFQSTDQPAGTTLGKLRTQIYSDTEKITSTNNALNVNVSSGLSAITNDGTFATPTKQDTTNTEIGGLTETAPASDTASSGLNGRLQRIAQRLTTLISGIAIDMSASFNNFRSLTVNTTAQVISASAGKVYGWNIINKSASTIYVKIYDVAATSVNPASSIPKMVLQVPASGSIYQEPDCVQQAFTTAISIRCVTGVDDTDIVNPGTLPLIVIK